jgi:DNA modification methylase
MILPAPYYEDSHVRIFHGDCRDILPGLSGIRCVVTSPPYNQLAQIPENGSGMWGGSGFVRAWRAAGYHDDMEESAYQAWQNEVFELAIGAVTPDASLFYNHQLRWRDGVVLHPVAWFRPEGWRLRQEIVWDRCGGMMFNARMFVRFDERVLWFIRGDSWVWNQESVGHGTVWRVAREQQQQGKAHPVAFPAEIPSRCIAATTDHGDLVLDPFAGSGTTGVAAKNQGRRAILIEIEERYCAIAANRCSQGVLDLEPTA